MSCTLAWRWKPGPVGTTLVALGLLSFSLGLQAQPQIECPGAEALVKATPIHPTAGSFTELGNWFGNHRQYTFAAEAFRSALKLNQASTTALDGLSRSLMADGDSASVVALLSKRNLNEALIVDLSRAFIAQGLFDDAARTLNAGLQKYPASQALITELGGLYVLENDGDKAVQVAEKGARAHPSDLNAQRFYLRMLVTKSDVSRATPLAHRLLLIAPNDADLLCLAGTIERVAADYPVARVHLERSTAIDTTDPRCHYNLAMVLAHLDDYARAKVELKTALELGDTDSDVHFQLAMALRNLGEAEEAKKQIRLYEDGKQLKANRTLASVKSSAAAQALAAGDASSAASLYREACEAQPQDAMLAYRLAVALDRSGDLVAERAALQHAVAIDPAFALAHEQLGYVESRFGNNSVAEECFRMAIRAAPEYAEAWVSLAATLAAQSRFPEARQAVATALRLEPKNANALGLSRNLVATAVQRQP